MDWVNFRLPFLIVLLCCCCHHLPAPRFGVRPPTTEKSTLFVSLKRCIIHRMKCDLSLPRNFSHSCLPTCLNFIFLTAETGVEALGGTVFKEVLRLERQVSGVPVRFLGTEEGEAEGAPIAPSFQSMSPNWMSRSDMESDPGISTAGLM